MKKALVVFGILVGAALATSAVRADKSGPSAASDNGCVGCVHDCLGIAKTCRLEARQERNECSRDCMTDLRGALADCPLAPDQLKRDCVKTASEDFSACKKDCDATVIADCAKVEEDCLKDCVQGPGGNITAARCADLCPVS